MLFRERRKEERERERERDTSVREKYPLVAFLYASRPGTKSAPWACTLMGNQTCNFLVYGMMLQPTEPLARAPLFDFLLWKKKIL